MPSLEGLFFFWEFFSGGVWLLISGGGDVIKIGYHKGLLTCWAPVGQSG